MPWHLLPSAFTIGSDDVHIIALSLKDKIPSHEYWLSLSDQERDNAGRFRFQGDKDHYIIIHGYLRHLFLRCTSLKDGNLIYGYSAYQKPYLKSNPELKFNLSHSEDHALIAITRNAEVGIDIEKIKNFDTRPVETLIFSKTEAEQLESVSEAERLHAFYSIWTQKEAVIKALGMGLSSSMTDFSVNINPCTSPYPIQKGGLLFTVKRLDYDPEFSAAIALSEPKTTYYYWRGE